MDDLVQWLRTQFNWDAAVARCACHLDEGQWQQDDPQRFQGRIMDDRGETVVKDEGMLSEQRARHVALHDPSRVLREIDAKRRIVECHEPWTASNGDTICGRCGREHIDGRPGGHYPCQTLRLLALPYADRAGYREEWRP